MKMRIWTTFIFLAALSLAYVRRHAASLSTFRNLPPADKQLYHDVRDEKDWRNPYIIIDNRGFDIVGGASGSVEHLATALAALPKSAWPYGKVVAVSTTALRSRNDDQLIQQNQTDALRILRDAGIEVKLWPSN
jgi:hypothetical protein